MSEQREIIFRGKRIDTDEWETSLYPYGKIICGTVANDFDISTVGQYTGLKDKKGVRIFDGDILESQIGDHHRWVVTFSDGGFCIGKIGVKPKKRQHQNSVDLLCADNVGFYELSVIGNIHDNPELLEAHYGH